MGSTQQRPPRRVGGVLVLYHRPHALFHRDADTVAEHAAAFSRHSTLGALGVNTDLGLPPGLPGLEFDAVILHYSLFGMTEFRLGPEFEGWLDASSAYKVAFFQDEYANVRRRLAWLRDHDVDCVYTCLEPRHHRRVYGDGTSVSATYTNLTGYVGEDLLESARRYGKPDEKRTVDVGYRGRPLPAWLGRGAQEKTQIGAGFAERAAGTGLRLDIALGEQDRIYGANWHRFMADCRCVLGVESGASAFDMNGKIKEEFDRLSAERATVTPDDLRTLDDWDGEIDIRTVSPRHFEAAAMRVCQIMFEGEYAGVMEAGRHYIPLKKDFSNFDEVVAQAKDPEVRRRITDATHADLIASGAYSYEHFVGDVEERLREVGVRPLEPADEARRVLLAGERLRAARTQAKWIRFGLRYRARWAREGLSNWLAR